MTPKHMITMLVAFLVSVLPNTSAAADMKVRIPIVKKTDPDPLFVYSGWKAHTGFLEDEQNAGWIGAFSTRQDSDGLRILQTDKVLYVHLSADKTSGQNPGDSFKLILRKGLNDFVRWDVVTVNFGHHEMADCVEGQSHIECSNWVNAISVTCPNATPESDVLNCPSKGQNPTYEGIILKRFPKTCTNLDKCASYSMEAKIRIPLGSYVVDRVAAVRREQSNVVVDHYFLGKTEQAALVVGDLKKSESQWVGIKANKTGSALSSDDLANEKSPLIKVRTASLSLTLENKTINDIYLNHMTIEIFARTFKPSYYSPNAGANSAPPTGDSSQKAVKDIVGSIVNGVPTTKPSGWTRVLTITNPEIKAGSSKFTDPSDINLEYAYDSQRECYYRPCVYARIVQSTATATRYQESVGYCFNVAYKKLCND